MIATAAGNSQEGNMRRRLTRFALTAALAGLLLFATAAPASADTVKVGSALQHPDKAGICTNCVGVQLAQAGGSAPLPIRSPANGVVTDWSVRTGDPGAIHSFRILRPTGGNTFTAAGTAVAPPVPGGTLDAVFGYLASLPIRQGDAVGVGVDPAHSLPQFTSNNLADVIGFSAGLPADGASVSMTPVGGHELLVQATVKFCNVPILKKLKTKPAKRALRAHDCLPKVKRSITKKDKFRGRVLKQKIPAGTTAAPGKVVPIVIGRKK
jgi:hypothetical protein